MMPDLVTDLLMPPLMGRLSEAPAVRLDLTPFRAPAR